MSVGWGCSMRLHGRWRTDRADLHVRRSLRSWVSSVRPPADGRRRLLWAASPGTGGGSWMANRRVGLASYALHSLASAVRIALANRSGGASYEAWGGATD